MSERGHSLTCHDTYMYITAKLHTRTSLMVAREDWRLCTHLVARYTKTFLRSGYTQLLSAFLQRCT